MDQQLALISSASSGNTIILTSGMSDDELRRVRAIIHPPPPAPTKMNLMANPEFIEIASVLASKLDHVRYKRRKAIIFTQPGVREHCDELMRNVMSPDILFHIDEWFSDVRGGDLDYDPTDPQADINTTRFRATMQLDWIDVLIKKELETNGFCKILYNCVMLEERVENCLKKAHRETMGTLGSASGFT